MNIPKIINSIDVFRAERSKREQNTNLSKFGLKMSQPLQKDTVCFRGTPKTFVERTLRKRDVIPLEKEAKEAYDYMHAKLYPYLYDLVTTAYTPKGIIESVGGRPKTAGHIIEKAGSRGWTTVEEVREKMTDIAGMRIVMRDSSQEAVNQILERLIQFTKETGVKIKEIENKRPMPTYDNNDNIIKSFDYGSPSILAKLQRVASRIAGRSIRYVDECPPTNYTAIHVLMELPNGITGELQIFGHDVDALKKIEDMCYKIKGNKHLSKELAPVEKMLAPLKDKENTYFLDEYEKYTAEAYVVQREKEQTNSPRPFRSKKKDTFLELPSYLREKYANLDFNKIAEKIEECLGKNNKKAE